MKSIPFINADQAENILTWQGVMNALWAAHQRPQADIDDILFEHDNHAVLSRAAWIQGIGIGVKTATIFPSNSTRSPALPTVHAIVTLFNDQTGEPIALLDGTLVTKWKTAGDSVLGAHLLARQDSETLTILGAGAVGESLIDAYRAIFTDLKRIIIWNRTFSKAQKLAIKKDIEAIANLEQAVKCADIVSSATMSIEPFIQGQWIKAGAHVDLIGAYRPDMREADDSLLKRARIFVDSRETALHDIGELGIPIKKNVISVHDIHGDLYDLCKGGAGRQSKEEITVFKNGGGAHLDLATASYIQKTLLDLNT